jgi:hypothetical protein
MVAISLVVVAALWCGWYFSASRQEAWETSRYQELSLKDPQALSPFEQEELRQIKERVARRQLDRHQREPITR